MKIRNEGVLFVVAVKPRDSSQMPRDGSNSFDDVLV